MIRERYAYGRGCVCIWVGIALGGLTDRNVFPRGTVNAYVNRYVRPYAEAIGDAFLLQNDNARLRRAPIVVNDYLQYETFMRME